MKYYFPFFFFVLFSSCAKKESVYQTNADFNKFEFTQEGIYKGHFVPINSSIVGMPSGSVRVNLLHDQFDIKIVMTDTPNSTHPQFIYDGERCPTIDDDLNQDGYLDAKEGEEVYGKALIPLDQNLFEQLDEEVEFPSSNQFGKYIYEQSASWSMVLEDLQLEDTNPKDHIIKLHNGINLDGKILVVHGVDNSTYLPSTVEGHTNLDVRSMLPIACAKISFIPKVDEL